ncbi:Oxygen tolerance [Muriicola jejuensis]|uniref:Protein BatD n=1 Tax=Muriicola jejuensis TaxID=504488 RepID=A0A6P0UAR1_9FLAO|nr:BatD family protein [Muriicola jejuensis]NER10127.1 protein BatD [Muriicola jejuensis]SMP02756.1 Oxygen tolerance [Muriicola jejuensis]
MKQTVLHKVLVILFLFGAMIGFAQEDEAVEFETNLSKEKLGLNERLRVEFTMNRDGDNFTPPNFEGFRVLMGPSQAISSSWINGVKSYSKTYSYTLAPTQRGVFTINQATIVIDGITYKTTPKKVEVTAAVDKPSDQLTADDIADQNLHLVAEVSKSNPYMNEAVSVVYKLYVSPTINVSNFRPLDNPTYNNFWSQDIPVTSYSVKNGTYEGKSYRYVILKRVVLYPQKSGALEIEPLSLEITLDVPTNRRDFFGQPIYTQTNKTVSAGNRTIEVQPLPQEGQPSDFSGAVGSFRFQVTTSKSTLKATESLQAVVEVEGNGNLKLFQLPALEMPGSLEVYEPEYNENVRTTLSGMQGKVSNNYTVVPSFKGNYPIPPIRFSYFDPEDETYKTLSSEEINIEVTSGPLESSGGSIPIASNNKRPVQATGSQFHFIKLSPDLTPRTETPFFGSLNYYLFFLSPLLIIPLAIIFGRRREAIASDVAGRKIKRANKLARKYLYKARKAMGEKDEFYIALEKALHNYLKAKLKIETTEFSKEKIEALFTKKKVDELATDGFISLLKNCEMARYSPFSQVQMQQDYDKAIEVISSLDKQL